MRDFIRRTRGPRPRIPTVEETTRSLNASRVWIGIAIFLLSCVFSWFFLFSRGAWDGTSQLSMVIVHGKTQDIARQLTIVTRKSSGEVEIMDLPQTLMIDALSGYGMYKSASLFGLTLLEKKPPQYLAQVLALNLGIAVKHVVWTGKAYTAITRKQLIDILFDQVVLKHTSTLSFADRIALWKAFHETKPDQFNTPDLSSSSMIRREEQKNGEVQFVVDPMVFDQFVFQVFADPALRKEGVTIAVVNTTKERSLASRVSRAFSAMGADVISVTTSNIQEEEKTKIVIKNEGMENAGVTTLMKHILRLTSSDFRQDSKLVQEYRADIVVFLGKDIAELLVGTR